MGEYMSEKIKSIKDLCIPAANSADAIAEAYSSVASLNAYLNLTSTWTSFSNTLLRLQQENCLAEAWQSTWSSWFSNFLNQAAIFLGWSSEEVSTLHSTCAKCFEDGNLERLQMELNLAKDNSLNEICRSQMRIEAMSLTVSAVTLAFNVHQIVFEMTKIRATQKQYQERWDAKLNDINQLYLDNVRAAIASNNFDVNIHYPLLRCAISALEKLIKKIKIQEQDLSKERTSSFTSGLTR